MATFVGFTLPSIPLPTFIQPTHITLPTTSVLTSTSATDLCSTYAPFFALSTYAPASSFCASYSCTDTFSTVTSTTTEIDTITVTQTSTSATTTTTTEIDTQLSQVLITSTLPGSFITVATSITTSTLHPTVTSTVTTTTTKTVLTPTSTATPQRLLAARDGVCTVVPGTCTTYVATEVVPRTIVRSSTCTETASGVSSMQTSSLPVYKSETLSTESSMPVYKSDTTSTSTSTTCTETTKKPTMTPSKSACKAKSKHSRSTSAKPTKSACSAKSKKHSSLPSSTGMVSSTCASASKSHSRKHSKKPSATVGSSATISSKAPSPTSVNTLATLLTSLQSQPSSIISSACSCIESSTCVTSTATSIITQRIATQITLTSEQDVTRTATVTISTISITTSVLITGVPTTFVSTITSTPTSTATTTQTVTSTSTVTSPIPSSTCAGGNYFEYTNYMITGNDPDNAPKYTFGSPGVKDNVGGCYDVCNYFNACAFFEYNTATSICQMYFEPRSLQKQDDDNTRLSPYLVPAQNIITGIHGSCKST